MTLLCLECLTHKVLLNLFQAIPALYPPCDLPFQPEDSQAPQAFLLLPHDTASALRCLPLNLLLLHLPVTQQFY